MALREFQRAYAQKAGQEFREPLQGLQAAMSSDPRLKGGFEAAGAELAKLSGIALRSVTHVVLVPVGVEFDRKMALGDGAAAANAAKNDKLATVMTVSNEVKSITRGEVAPEMFAPPVGYREIRKSQP